MSAPPDPAALNLWQARAVLSLYAHPPHPIATQGFLQGGAVAVQAVVQPGDTAHHFWIIRRNGHLIEHGQPFSLSLPWAAQDGWIDRERLLAMAQQIIEAYNAR